MHKLHRPNPRTDVLRRRLLASGLLGGLAACGSRPPEAPPAPAAPVAPRPVARSDAWPAEGVVLGANERLLLFRPGTRDTLASMAQRFLGSADKAWVIAEFNAVQHAVAGEPLVVPLRPINPTGVRPGRVQTVPILCYHRFGPPGGKMIVTPGNFAQQLDWLARNGYSVVPLARLPAFLEGREALPQRSVVITIDDGYESTYSQALPALRRHGFPATVFVYTDFVGAGDALSWSQLRELVASGLFEIGAHSKTHRNLSERLARETEAQYRSAIDLELRASRALLEKQLGIRVRFFAMPYGDANALVLDALERQDYTLAATVSPGGNPFFGDRLMLRRTMVMGDHDLAAFRNTLQTSRPGGTR